MTPEEFRNAMMGHKENDDVEDAHKDADVLMCKVLRSLGYAEGVEVFEKMQKWYA